MRRSVVLPEVNKNCINERANYKSMADYERTLKNELGTYFSRFEHVNGDDLISLKENDNAIYNIVFSNLQMAENNLNKYISCIHSDLIQRNTESSKLYNLQQEIEELRKEAAEKKGIAKESTERAGDLENPYNKTTWYETWFPLGRPIQKENVPVLLSVSILMLVVSLGIFLRFAGMELRLDSLQSSTNSLLKNISSRKYP